MSSSSIPTVKPRAAAKRSPGDGSAGGANASVIITRRPASSTPAQPASTRARPTPWRCLSGCTKNSANAEWVLSRRGWSTCPAPHIVSPSNAPSSTVRVPVRPSEWVTHADSHGQ